MARKLRCAPVRARAHTRREEQYTRAGLRARGVARDPFRSRLGRKVVARRGLASRYLEQVRRLARLH